MVVKRRAGAADGALSPTVQWAQRKEHIFLKVILNRVENPKFDVQESSIGFTARGHGAKGIHQYAFQLKFFKPIVEDSLTYNAIARCVEIKLEKKEHEWWPRLLPEKHKTPHFLKIDFDKWVSDSDDEEERKLKEMLASGMHGPSDEDVTELDKYFTSPTGYLVLYNCIQTLLFTYVFCTAVFAIVTGNHSLPKTFHHFVVFTIGFSYLEVIHCLIGIVKSKWTITFVQVTGRCIALTALWIPGYNTDDFFDSLPVIGLYAAWSLADICRYPFYISQLFSADIKTLTWFRYNIWIPLYPIGVFCEFLVVSNAIHFLEKTKLYRLHLPNLFNITISLSYGLRVYCPLLFIGLYTLMLHMWRMRQRKVGGGRRKFKSA